MGSEVTTSVSLHCVQTVCLAPALNDFLFDVQVMSSERTISVWRGTGVDLSVE